MHIYTGIPENVPFIRTGSKEFVEVYYPAMAKYCLEHTAAEVLELGEKCHCMANEYIEFKDMPNLPLYQARENFIEGKMEDTGETIKMVAPIPKFKKNPQQIWRLGPTKGQDNEDVLEELGYTADDIKGLYDKGVLTIEAIKKQK